MKKIRFDTLLCERGFFESREQAKKAIMAGLVKIDEKVITKAGEQVGVDIPDSAISIKGNLFPYVSRGGLKLEKGLKVFDFPVEDLVFLDIGASTGGFTHCLLLNGAKLVYSIDVGYGQLDWKLRNDPKVICMERTNFRYLSGDEIEIKPNGSVMDVSFISILKLLPKIHELTPEGSLGIWLIKPQFEAGRENIGKNGVIKDKKIHEAVLQKVIQGIQAQHFEVIGLDVSPIRGPKGNIEFLCHTKHKGDQEVDTIYFQDQIHQLVEKAHAYE